MNWARIGAVFLVAGVVCAASTAEARLKVCNRTGLTLQAAVGYFGLHGWTSEGWWELAPKRCFIPIRGELEKRYYYVLGKNTEKNYHAGGKNRFCTTPEDFKINGPRDCEKRGFADEWFGEIDKGAIPTYNVDFIDDTTKQENRTFGFTAYEGKRAP